ncbi:hypothetical protein J6590_018019 [Homalodisca vitripennis]|nr:hypothetical protein J6590_018019 [Homalodisca vitripennis]
MHNSVSKLKDLGVSPFSLNLDDINFFIEIPVINLGLRWVSELEGATFDNPKFQFSFPPVTETDVLDYYKDVQHRSRAMAFL